MATVEITPAFVVALVGLSAVLVVHTVTVARWTQKVQDGYDRLDEKVKEHGAVIADLRQDRHDHRERIVLLESRADATDKEFDRQHEEERDLRVAVSELIQQRRTA